LEGGSYRGLVQSALTIAELDGSGVMLRADSCASAIAGDHRAAIATPTAVPRLSIPRPAFENIVNSNTSGPRG
jgi:hypothetical protein